MKYCFSLASAVLISATSLDAQAINYGNNTQSGERVEKVEELPKANDLFLDSELRNLPSDLSFRRWSERQRSFFGAADQDGDGVLSERDLQGSSPEKVSEWAEAQVKKIFSFWLPHIREHLDGLKTEMELVHQEDEILAELKGAHPSIKRAFQSLRLDKPSVKAYVYPKLLSNPSITRTGLVARDHRSWVEVSIPISLIVETPNGTSDHAFVVSILAMRKFPRHVDDDAYAIWEVSIFNSDD